MNVILDPELQQLIEQKVANGEFDSVNAVIEHALRASLGVKDRNTSAPLKREARPIAAIFEEIRRSLPSEEQQAIQELPEDFAAEHDFYLYGTPKKYS